MSATIPEDPHAAGAFVDADLAQIADTIDRLNARQHTEAARLVLTRDGGQDTWLATILADPLTSPLGGIGRTPERALAHLCEQARVLDWRTVKA